MPPVQRFQEAGGRDLGSQGVGRDSVKEQGEEEHPAQNSWDIDVLWYWSPGSVTLVSQPSFIAGHQLPPFWRGALGPL